MGKQIGVILTKDHRNEMGDFTQPQQNYAGTGENCNIAIALIYYPGIKTLWKFLCI